MVNSGRCILLDTEGGDMKQCPYPQFDICEDIEQCKKEHNPHEEYETHHYGCECEGCLEWYRSLK